MQLIKAGLCAFRMSGKIFHAPFLKQHPGFFLEGIVERTKNDSQEKHPESKIYRSVEEMLEKQQASYFDEFYNTFPVYVLRPDGTKGYLKANVNKCRKEYNKIIGKSKAMHDHIMDCLKFELQDKVTIGKMIYMQTMWKWLVQHGWEYYEDRVKEETIKTEAYGTTVF